MMASAWIYNNAVTNHDNSWSLHFAIPDDKRLELVAATNAIVNSENNRARGVSARAVTPRALFSFCF